MRLSIVASRSVDSPKLITSTARPPAPRITTQLKRGIGANGLRSVTMSPRPGRLALNSASAPMITMKGTRVSKPPSRKAGTWRVLTRCTASPENMPMAMPPITAQPNDLSRAASAAARAATR